MVTQINTLLAFFIAGVCIGIIFDFFRIIRKSFKTPDILTYIQDILFWILAGIILLFTIFTFTTCEIRIYMFIFLFFGVFIYFISETLIINKSCASKSFLNQFFLTFIRINSNLVCFINYYHPLSIYFMY